MIISKIRQLLLTKTCYCYIMLRHPIQYITIVKLDCCQIRYIYINTSRPFPYSWFIIECVARVKQRVPRVEQELFTFGEPQFTPRFSGACVTRSLVLLCSVLQIAVCLFVLFHLAIVLSVLRFTDSEYPFGIFKLFYFLLPVYYFSSASLFTSVFFLLNFSKLVIFSKFTSRWDKY